jgi:hypothetical protein
MRRRTAAALVLALAAAALFGARAASAQCAVPNTLANGATADASQVMGNFNAVTGCVNALPAGSVNALQYNYAPGAFGAIGPLVDGQVPIGQTGARPLARYLTAGSGITITNAPGSITISATTPPGGGAGGAPQGRLTLTSGTPVMSADVSNATTVFYDCYVGSGVPYFTGSADVWGGIAGCEISTVLKPSGTGALNGADVFDVFYNGTMICVVTNGSGAGWSGDSGGSVTARGTGYTKVHNVRGYLTNATSLSHCYNGATNEPSIAVDHATYLGSIFTTAAGQTSAQHSLAPAAGGTNAVLGLYNGYNLRHQRG